MSREAPLLSAVVVQWHTDEALAALLQAWPTEDQRFELVVVDNGSERAPRSWGGGVRTLSPERNLGFAGGVNLGVHETEAPHILVLNPDACPRPGALDALLRGFEAHPHAAGLVPRLVGTDGRRQSQWQLRPVPSAWELLRQTLLLPGVAGLGEEPLQGERIGQPAAAALALRREALTSLDGFDERFFPAWFEDVDLARRAELAGLEFLYLPSAVFEHQLGSSVPALGYQAFLAIYYRNLVRYLDKHHGPGWAGAARTLLPFGMLARVALLAIRRPRRAASRSAAAAALFGVALAAVCNWRRPRRVVSRLQAPLPVGRTR